MSFPLAGNARIRGALTAAIESGRLPHAILIEGDKGTGRHTLAAFTARAAVCERRVPRLSAGACGHTPRYLDGSPRGRQKEYNRGANKVAAERGVCKTAYVSPPRFYNRYGGHYERAGAKRAFKGA